MSAEEFDAEKRHGERDESSDNQADASGAFEFLDEAALEPPRGREVSISVEPAETVLDDVEPAGRRHVEAEGQRSMGSFEGQEMRPSSDQMTAAKVEANAPASTDPQGPDTGGRLSDAQIDCHTPEEMTGSLAAARERALGREWELAQYSEHVEHTRSDGLTETIREVKAEQAVETREAVVEMDIGGFDPTHHHPAAETAPVVWTDDLPDVEVPLGGLDEAVQAEAAREAKRASETADTRYSALGMQWLIGDRLRVGQSMSEAVLHAVEAAEQACPDTRGPGVEQLGRLEDAPYGRVTVEGEISQLWTADHDGIYAVGLLEDETGKSKFTVWKSALQRGLTTTYSEPGYARWFAGAAFVPTFEEGDEVRFEYAKRTWHEGRANIELDRRAEF